MKPFMSLFSKEKKNLKTNFIICNINACINSHKQGFFPVSAAVNMQVVIGIYYSQKAVLLVA